MKSDTSSSNAELESQEKSTVDVSKFPEGGIQAWLVAAGGFSTTFSCLGFSNSFGSFAEYYISNQLRGRSPDDIAWIGSISAFLQLATGVFFGPLFDRFGAGVRHQFICQMCPRR